MNQLQRTLVKKGATLGANCTIICGLTVGGYAFVGAGSLVTKDVPDYALVVGSPARPIGWVCQCGEKLALHEKQALCVCGKQYKQTSAGYLQAI
jgi:UDP-2-acetamido-3-amino-2,3-dideoxy-glucuronate N-acetyltransferase